MKTITEINERLNFWKGVLKKTKEKMSEVLSSDNIDVQQVARLQSYKSVLEGRIEELEWIMMELSEEKVSE